MMSVSLRLILEKSFYLFLSLFFVASLTFILMKTVPGDPFSDQRGMPKEVLEQLKRAHGLDQPLSVQYLNYLKAVVTLDFGSSLKYNARNVQDIIKQGFPISALLGLQALAFSLSGGMFFGTLAALGKKKWPDQLVLGICALAISLPSFVAATLLQYIFAIHWDIFPIARWGTWQHSVLPALSLAIVPTAFIAKLFRASILEVLNQPYIQMAKAKGLSTRRIIIAHIWKNSLLPVIGYLGILATNLLIGSFVVEKIFGIPGLGQWFVSSVINRDYPIIAGLTLFYSTILIAFNTLSDVVQQLLDPRLRKTTPPLLTEEVSL